ncbi:MAG: hypothetical protein ABF242_01525 [Flavobacteriales bacterium]
MSNFFIDYLFSPSQKRRYLIVLLTAVTSYTIALVILFLTFNLLVYFYPSEVVLEDGSKVQLIAMGQFFISVAIAILSFVVLMYLFFNLFDKKIKHNLFKK